MNALKKMIVHMITGIDGETVDPARVLWILGCMVFFAGSIDLMVQGKWDMQTYGIALAAVLCGGGLGVRAKAETEPKAAA